jgi:hypothetical protein
MYRAGNNLGLTLTSFVLFLAGCSSQGGDKSSDLMDYNNCLQTETDKLLDEIGSSLDYARGEALKVCESL